MWVSKVSEDRDMVEDISEGWQWKGEHVSSKLSADVALFIGTRWLHMSISIHLFSTTWLSFLGTGAHLQQSLVVFSSYFNLNCEQIFEI